MNIGTALRYYRELKGMTQWDLSSKSGVNDKYYGRIERNESSPTVNKLEKICYALNLEVSELVKRAEDIEKTNLLIENDNTRKCKAKIQRKKK